MAQGSPSKLLFPQAGLRKDLGYEVQFQQPFWTPDCKNVRPFDSQERKARGGSRDGLSRIRPTLLGSGNPVRLLDQVTVVPTDSGQIWRDYFDKGEFPGGVPEPLGIIKGNWTVATWVTDWSAGSPNNGLPRHGEGFQLELAGGKNPAATGTIHRGAHVTTLDNIDTTARYKASFRFYPLGTGCTIRLFILVTDDAAGNGDTWYNTTGGIVVEYTQVTAGADDNVWKVFARDDTGIDFGTGAGAADIDGTGAYTGTDVAATLAGTDISIDWTPGTDTLTVKIADTTVVDAQVITWPSSVPTGAKIGFESQTVAGLNLTSFAKWFTVDYLTSQFEQNNKTFLAAGANGIIYADTVSGEMVDQTGTGPKIATDHHVASAEYLQRLYIADEGVLHRGTNGASVATSKQFTSSGALFQTAPAVEDDEAALVIVSGTNVTAGTYTIASVDSETQVTLDLDPVDGAGPASAVVYRIERSPKIWDYTGAVNSKVTQWEVITTASQQVPVGRTAIAVYSDRIVMGGPDHIWYLSRQGVPDGATIFDTSGNSGGRAFIGTQIRGGRISSPIRAFIPLDDFMVILCTYQTWVLRGDPGFGSAYLLSRSQQVGCVDYQAWCFGPSNEIYFLSQSGLYRLLPDPNAVPTPVSEDVLPDELRKLNMAQYEVRLAYDVDRRGVKIAVIDQVGTLDSYYFVHLPSVSFWSDSYESDHGSTALLSFEPDDGQNLTAVLGGRDGYLRQPDPTAEDDDGTAISSYVFLGPFGGREFETVLDSVRGILDQTSGDVTWSVHVGRTAEAALAAAASASGTFSAGLSDVAWVNRAGKSLFIKLSSSVPWAMEVVEATFARGGMVAT